MNLEDKAGEIGRILDDLYQDPQPPLEHDDPFTLLVAVILSAQCTDKRVNQVTPALFARARTPQAMSQMAPEEIETIIRSCGLAPRKSQALQRMSQMLLDDHQGEVPASFEALERLPGVGHKTASVVMAQAFDVPAFPVDTHILRLARRWGLSEGKNVRQVEADLKRLYPPETWGRRHLQFIFFGREYCPARGHDPAGCPICSLYGV